MDCITIGQSVKIKRTDGRVHEAIVSNVTEKNETGKSVVVEWYEHGETKGKEIELDAILNLNPELRRLSPRSGNSNVAERKMCPNSTCSIHTSRSVVNAHTLFSSTASIAVNTQSNNLKPCKTKTITNVQPAPRRTEINAINATNLSNSSYSTINSNATSNAPNGNINRSFTVKEVERLKDNREKRRARQALLKEQKIAQMNADRGNPNWETARMIREYQNTLVFRSLMDGQEFEEHQIAVCVRKRPLSRKELRSKEVDVISVPQRDTLIVHEPRNKVDLTKYLEHHKFRFDYAFDDYCDNAMVYKYTAKPLVQTIFDGGMATCFAYGQTGSGKTHTMGGEFNGKVQDYKNGIYAMAAKDVFVTLKNMHYRSLNLVVSLSFFEIYGGKVFDLLADKQKLRVLEDGRQQVQVVGLTEKSVDKVEDVLKLIQHGNAARTSGQTSANSNSSRSHAVFQIVLRARDSKKIHGKFSFIDLAGNERGADTSSADRQTRMEGAEINKSLLALKECIRALGRQSAHLPFRVSKLTQVLRDSFIGEKSKTCMIAMISPGLSSCEHTLNTLRYADRVKELVVKDSTLEDIQQEAKLNDVQMMQVDENENCATGVEHKNYNYEDENMNIDHKTNNIIGNDDNENNLALLRSLSEHDMSDKLLVQHAAISDLQHVEECVVDQHRAVNEFLSQFLPESQRLYNLTNYVDYDQDAYSKQAEAIFTQLSELSTGCKEMMSEFRAKLAKEEMMSIRVKSQVHH